MLLKQLLVYILGINKKKRFTTLSVGSVYHVLLYSTVCGLAM